MKFLSDEWNENWELKARRDALIEEVRDLGADPKLSDEIPVEESIEYLERVIEWEKSDAVKLRDFLLNKTEGTWFSFSLELMLETLMSANIVIFETDHLNDDELRKILMSDCIIDRVEVRPAVLTSTLYKIPVCSFQEDAIDCWLTYYANEEDRKEWELEHPNRLLPDRKEITRNRDDEILDRCEVHFRKLSKTKFEPALHRMVLYSGLGELPIDYAVVHLGWIPSPKD